MRFEILGPMRVSVRDREVAIRAGRDRTFLAMLVLSANHTVPVADLVDGLWADKPPHHARSQLHGCVSRLRKQFANAGVTDPIIATEPEGYRLLADATMVDLLEFRSHVGQARAAGRNEQREMARDHYRAALKLWRGPALAGIDRGTASIAAGLDEERAQVEEEWVEVELALGAASELIGELTDLVSRYPYRERLHAALMLALYRADRQADALAAYQRIRRTLVTELGQEPGSLLRELHQRILTGDPDLRPGKPEPAAHKPPASRYLPRTLTDFTGRDTDLAWLVEAASQTDLYAPLVLAIDGMPGVGKTSLAVRAAHLLAPGYPDGQLFIDLHGRSDRQPVEPMAALDTLLRQLGVPPASIPTEPDDRVARWRAELGDRQALILLDNAATSAQISPLLPASAGCLVLVTSRHRLVGLDGARPHSVDTLSVQDAVNLIARVAGERVRDEPAATTEVAQRCGYLPLALRLAAARLAHRPRWHVQDLADRLSAPQTLFAELTADGRTLSDAFALSYAYLTPTAQRLFRMLGLHPGRTFDAYAAAALAGIGLADAQHLLDELADAHLLDELYSNRYQYHDLVKAYASELSQVTDPEPDRRRAVHWLLDYYLHAAAAASAGLETVAGRQTFQIGDPIRPDLVKAGSVGEAEWLETERPSLVAATGLAAAQGELVYAWQIARAIWKFFVLRCYLDDLIETHQIGLAAAERLPEPAAAAIMHNGLAPAYNRRGMFQVAIEHLRHTVAWREKTGDTVGEALARKNLALTYSLDGQAHQAIDHIEGALAVARRSGNAHALTAVVVNAGFVYAAIGRHAVALSYSRNGLTLAREVGDHYLLAHALGNIGAHRAQLGEPDHALRLLVTALKLKRRFVNRASAGETLNDIGMTYRMLGRPQEAITYHRQALALMREIGSGLGECTVHNEFGQTLRATGDTADALKQHRQALDLATKIRHRYSQARALDGIGACVRDIDPEDARRHWLRALQLYRELDLPERHDIERRLRELGT